MLMEFAEERRQPAGSASPFRAAKARLTPVWQSSKLPRTAQTFTFAPTCVTICAFCTGETPASG